MPGEISRTRPTVVDNAVTYVTRSFVNPQIAVFTSITAPVRRDIVDGILERGFVLRKLEKCGYQSTKNIDDTFSHFDIIPELLLKRDGRAELLY